jgi:outer membrane protein assembly factor BamB
MNLPLLTILWAALLGAADTERLGDARLSAFEDFATSAEFPSVDTLCDVLRPVEGFPGEITESSKLGRPAARIAGLLRYDGVWPAGSALRVALVDIQSLAIHLWAGEQGVSLRFRSQTGRNGTQWIVYGVRRQATTPRSEQLALWATDEGRFRRLGEGTFELRWADGLLAMTRGDIVLWRVPLESPPQEVFFDGTAIVRGLGTFRAAALPPETPDLPLVRDVRSPAELAWQERLPAGAIFNKLREGGVELSGAEHGAAALAFVDLTPAGLHEFVFELDIPEPGTGVYLGDESGEPVARAGFFRIRGREGVTFGLTTNRSPEWERSYADPAAIPYAGARVWLRVVLAGGVFRLWTSGDGRHWSETPDSAVHASGRCRTVGLYCLANASPTSLRLRSMQVRRLDALTALAPAELVEQIHAPAVRGDRRRTSSGSWGERPEGVSEEVWRRAVALRMLIDSPRAATGLAGLNLLLSKQFLAERPIDECLRTLAQSARIVDGGDSRQAMMLAALYEPLGQRLMAQRDPLAFQRIRQAMCQFVPSPMPAAAAGQLLRYQLLLAAYEGRWADVAQQAQELQFWSRSRAWASQPLPPWEQGTGGLLDWVAVQLEAQRRARQAQPDTTPAKDDTRPLAVTTRGHKAKGARPVNRVDTTHPLVERLAKEAYNAAADLEAALAGGALREACQTIGSTRYTAAGLVPSEDPQLAVALRVTIEQALATHAALTPAMEQRFGALAELRFRQATEAADADAVAALTDQFPGTQAARRAALWLGDRALADGRFLQALACYRRAAPPASDPGAARLRLAAALIGLPLDEAPLEPVELGDVRMPAAEFAQLLATLRARSAPASAPPTALPVPRSTALTPVAWAQIPDSPEQRPWRGRRSFDLAARETVIRCADDLLLVRTLARLLAFRLNDGRLAWTYTIPPAGDRAPAWAGLGEPVAAGTHVFLRHGLGRNAMLVCLDRTTGSVVWTSPADTPVVSDAVLVGPQVFALIATPAQAGQLAIEVAEFDAADGRPCGRWPVVELRDVWQGALAGRATWADDTLVAAVGGCVVACDAAGRVRWIRRQLFFAPQADGARPWHSLRNPEAPRVLHGRVYVTQPGVWAVECLELATGRLLWRRAEPELTALVGVDGQRVVLATDSGLVGLDALTGKQLWSHVDLEQLDAGVIYDGRHALHATLCPVENRTAVCLEWLDVADGAVRACVPLALAEDRRPGVGPLAVGATRLWAVLPRDGAPQRDIVQLRQ